MAKETLTQVYSANASKSIEDLSGAFDKVLQESIYNHNINISGTCKNNLDKLDDWLFKSLKEQGDALLEKLNSSISLEGTSQTINTAVMFICNDVNEFIKEVLNLIEITATYVIVIIDKLIKAIEKAMEYLRQLANAIASCVQQLITKLLNMLDRLTTITFDDNFISALDDCPQLFCMVKSLLGPLCGSNATNTRELIDCLNATLDTPFIDLLADRIRAGIYELLSKTEKIIEDTKNAILSPVRRLAKVYLGLLHDKRPIPKPFRWIFATASSCKGKRRASVVEMLRALRTISECIDSLCSIGPELKRDIQSYNEDMRIAMSYWSGYNFGYDLFITLEDSDTQERIRTQIRELEIDKNKDNNIITSITEKLKNTDEVTDPFESEFDSIHATTKQSLIDSGVVMENGIVDFMDNVESDMVRIYSNLGKEAYRYEGKINEFFEWDSTYKKTDLLESKKSLSKLINQPTYDVINVFESDKPVYVKYKSITQPVKVTSNYVYKPLKSTVVAPTRNYNESDADYYNRWYTSLRN